jgi:diacylglycerol kinase
VWLAEALNTAIERLTDLVSPEFRPLAGEVKDLAAAAVLLSALGAVAVACAVFGPSLLH